MVVFSVDFCAFRVTTVFFFGIFFVFVVVGVAVAAAVVFGLLWFRHSSDWLISVNSALCSASVVSVFVLFLLDVAVPEDVGVGVGGLRASSEAPVGLVFVFVGAGAAIATYFGLSFFYCYLPV